MNAFEFAAACLWPAIALLFLLVFRQPVSAALKALSQIIGRADALTVKLAGVELQIAAVSAQLEISQIPNASTAEVARELEEAVPIAGQTPREQIEMAGQWVRDAVTTWYERISGARSRQLSISTMAGLLLDKEVTEDSFVRAVTRLEIVLERTAATADEDVSEILADQVRQLAVSIVLRVPTE